jgi:hypothetical protein
MRLIVRRRIARGELAQTPHGRRLLEPQRELLAEHQAGAFG